MRPCGSGGGGGQVGHDGGDDGITGEDGETNGPFLYQRGMTDYAANCSVAGALPHPIADGGEAGRLSTREATHDQRNSHRMKLYALSAVSSYRKQCQTSFTVMKLIFPLSS